MKLYFQAVSGGLLMTFAIGEAAELGEKPLHTPANAYATHIAAQTSVSTGVALDLNSTLQYFRAIRPEPVERLADEASQYRPAAEVFRLA
jgi:hypothetical protein